MTATPKSPCASILGFFRAEMRKSATLPELVRQVADSLHDHGVKAVILDDVSRLRMHRADDQDVPRPDPGLHESGFWLTSRGAVAASDLRSHAMPVGMGAKPR
ncbi:hypothetical protein [Streptomyces bobili]|uniref:hypothetical protein n=1 Tax=Streptomyces bobili TaxID=67280 RepID=UPI001FC9CC73|nr:hypothetical protein [Streptomyces bobili]